MTFDPADLCVKAKRTSFVPPPFYNPDGVLHVFRLEQFQIEAGNLSEICGESLSQLKAQSLLLYSFILL